MVSAFAAALLVQSVHMPSVFCLLCPPTTRPHVGTSLVSRNTVPSTTADPTARLETVTDGTQ